MSCTPEHLEYAKRYREKNKDRHRAWSRVFREKNKDKIAAEQREYYEKNKDRIKARALANHKENRQARLERMRIYCPDWKNKNKDRVRETARRWRAKEKEKRIKLAGRPPPERCESCFEKRKLCWDHDHNTGKFRGWICAQCNTALGQLSDDPIKLRRLLEYLFKSLRVAT